MSIASRVTFARGMNAFRHARQLLYAATVASANAPVTTLALKPDRSPLRSSFPLRNTALRFSSSAGGAANSSLPAMGVLSELASRLEAPTLLRSSRQDQESSISNERTGRMTLEELSSQLCHEYLKLPPLTFAEENEKGRKAVLEYLGMNCFLSDEKVSSAVQHYLDNAPTESSESFRHLKMQLMSKLRESCTPLYEKLFQCLLEEDARQGMVFLVRLRQDLREWIRWKKLSNEHEDEITANMKQLDAHLRDLLSTWFSSGMLGM